MILSAKVVELIAFKIVLVLNLFKKCLKMRLNKRDKTMIYGKDTIKCGEKVVSNQKGFGMVLASIINCVKPKGHLFAGD